MVQVYADTSRPPPGSPGATLKVGGDQGIVEVGVAEDERLAPPHRRCSPLELLERDVDPGLEQLVQRALDSFMLHQVLHVAQRASRGPEQLEVGAARIPEDGPLDLLKKRDLARLHPPMDVG